MNFVFRPDLMLEVLPVLGIGLLGIFIVTGVIVGCISLLNKFTG